MSWIRAAATRAVLAAARSRGLDPDEVLRRAGASSLPEDAWAIIPLPVHFGAIEHSVRLTNDPGFIVDIARHVPVETYDVMGFAMRSAPTLGAAVDAARRYQPLYTTSSVFEVERSKQGLSIWARPSGPLPLAARCATESMFAQMLEVSRQLSGHPIVPLQVSFRHPAPRSLGAHQAFFATEIQWEAPLARISFSSQDAHRQVQHADARLHDFLLRTAEAALAEHRPPDTFLDQVQRTLAELLPSGSLSLESAGARLGLSERTLRRRLNEHGTSFLELRDRVRLDLAKRYLGERTLPLGEIAFLLDFADERAFRRSFQRWTGASPAKFRASL